MHKTYNVAIADDDSPTRNYLRHCLIRAGHRVVLEANNGEDLVKQCSAVAPDLIITDIQMPGIDGLEAAQRILTEHDIPVIVVSGLDPEYFADRASLCRPLAYLTKPLREDQLLATITVAMQRFAELQSLRGEASSVRQALEDRKIIERAKGIVMSKLHFDEPSAFHHLQKLARSHRQQMVEVARNIIFADEAFTSAAEHDAADAV